jgi:hypothetical protein
MSAWGKANRVRGDDIVSAPLGSLDIINLDSFSSRTRMRSFRRVLAGLMRPRAVQAGTRSLLTTARSAMPKLRPNGVLSRYGTFLSGPVFRLIALSAEIWRRCGSCLAVDTMEIGYSSLHFQLHHTCLSFPQVIAYSKKAPGNIDDNPQVKGDGKCFLGDPTTGRDYVVHFPILTRHTRYQHRIECFI